MASSATSTRPAAAATTRPRRPLSGNMPLWVLIGALLGILVGLTIGERAALLRPVGMAYTMMLESVIYPYILSSVIAGLGGLAPARALRLFRASWLVYLFLWGAVFATIFILAAAIPPTPPPIEIAAAETTGLPLLRVLIPSRLSTAATRHSGP